MGSSKAGIDHAASGEFPGELVAGTLHGRWIRPRERSATYPGTRYWISTFISSPIVDELAVATWKEMPSLLMIEPSNLKGDADEVYRSVADTDGMSGFDAKWRRGGCRLDPCCPRVGGVLGFPGGSVSTACF